MRQKGLCSVLWQPERNKHRRRAGKKKKEKKTSGNLRSCVVYGLCNFVSTRNCVLLRHNTLDDKSTSDCRRNRAVCSDIVTTHYMAAILYLYTLFGLCSIISHINFTLECAYNFQKTEAARESFIFFHALLLESFFCLTRLIGWLVYCCCTGYITQVKKGHPTTAKVDVINIRGL